MGAGQEAVNELDLGIKEPSVRAYLPPEDRSQNEHAFVIDYLTRFMSTPKELRKPEVVGTNFIDYDSIRGAMTCLKALETAPIPD